MAQKKRIRFEAIKSFPNVLQYPTGMAGNWSTFFKNQNPIVLELACGRGEYTVHLAKLHPGKNFIGADLKGNRIFIGAKKCLEEKIENACFLRTHIDKINLYFAENEVSEIWLTFPDPHLRNSKAKKRLTHPKFLRLYRQILGGHAPVHLKTDSPDLYRFTQLVIALYGLALHEKSDDVYASPAVSEELRIKTHYERLDISGSNRVHYLKFSIPMQLSVETDERLQQRIFEDETAVN